MPRVQVYNHAGDVVREEELDAAVFAVPAKQVVIHEVVEALRANRRRVTAHTKMRGEVRGGGKKPWAQKGTGRARHGSTRSPIWRGGGVTFGPRNDRNYTKKINQKVRQLALRMCLSEKVAGRQLVLLESFDMPGQQKTKAVASVLKKLQIPLQKKHAALVVLPKGGHAIGRFSRNIPAVYTTRSTNLNVLDVLRYPYFITTVEEIHAIGALFKGRAPRKNV